MEWRLVGNDIFSFLAMCDVCVCVQSTQVNVRERYSLVEALRDLSFKEC